MVTTHHRSQDNAKQKGRGWEKKITMLMLSLRQVHADVFHEGQSVQTQLRGVQPEDRGNVAELFLVLYIIVTV